MLRVNRDVAAISGHCVRNRALFPEFFQRKHEVLDVIGTETHDAIRSIKAALRRMEEGSYGDCERCGGPIAASRLEVLPEATLCIDCAE